MRWGKCVTPLVWAVLSTGASGQTSPAVPASAATTTSAPTAVPVSAPAAVPAPASSPAPLPTSPSPPSTTVAVASAPAVTTASAPAIPATAPSSPPAGGLAVRDGDLIVFLGDELSETPEAFRANRPTFPQLVETFLTVRYPAIHVRYISVGWTGDTTARALLRLKRDVLDLQPTVVVVCLGMNDPGYLGFIPDRLEQTKKDLSQIVERCRKAGARVWLMSPPCVEEDRGKKARITRDGQRAIADLEVIHYNQTLSKYTAAVREIATAAAAGFADWFGESSATRALIQPHTGDDFLTIDGRMPSFRGTILGAGVLLRAWGAEPIRATIDLDWVEGSAQITSHLGNTHAVPVQITEDGKRIVNLTDLPLPWPLPGDPSGALRDGWKTSELCQIIFRMPNPPEMGITLLLDTDDQNAGGQCPITAAQLQAGFNLATAEPLRLLRGVRDLYNLMGTKNRTRDTIWRRLQMSAPQQVELTQAHRQLIEAWTAYVAGYERMIAGTPKTFSARFVLSETVESENLPTSQPTRPPRILRPSGSPIPATLPTPVNP
jgi:lysophospholipase L1-like esterase